MMDKDWKYLVFKKKNYRVSYCSLIEKFHNNQWIPVKCYKSNSGYLLCSLGLVHRVVAKYYIPNPKNLPQVNHKDCNKLNCHADNLEWCTAKYNTEHSMLNGIKKTGVSNGSKNGQSILTEDEVKKIKSLFGIMTGVEIAKEFGVSQATISGIKNNRFWRSI